MLLRDLAHARAGDKGDISCISVIARDARDYEWLLGEVSEARVAAHLGGLVRGAVRRYAVPTLGALNFVLDGALAGGVTRSLALDPHGKGLSWALLSLPVATPPRLR